MKNTFLTGAVMVLLLFSCKKDLGIPANGLQADHKYTVLANSRPNIYYGKHLPWKRCRREDAIQILWLALVVTNDGIIYMCDGVYKQNTKD
jgi:hypothetical protein